MAITLGIDIGGSGIKGGMVDTLSGELCAPRLRLPTPPGGGVSEVLDTVKRLVLHFEARGPVGLTFPGIVRQGRVQLANNMHPGWAGLDVVQTFSQTLGRPVQVLNDADAAGLAEAKFGAGMGLSGTIILLTFGTGLGSALIQNGGLVPNTELGQLWLRQKQAEAWTADRTRRQSRLGWKQWTKRVSKYLQHLELLFSPDLIILGGGVSKRAEQWLPLVQTNHTPVVSATLRNEAGMVGAALYALMQTRRELEHRV